MTILAGSNIPGHSHNIEDISMAVGCRHRLRVLEHIHRQEHKEERRRASKAGADIEDPV